MKNKRKISKDNTRSLILEKTRELIIINGILKTSTKQIAEFCKVAHGTLFSHFHNREELISQVIKDELIRIAKKLYQINETNRSFEDLLDSYLNLVAEEEDLLVVVTNEFPFFSKNLKREIITTESIVKKFFHHKIKIGIETGMFKPLPVQTIISFLFGTISYYLGRREYFVQSGSVIREKKKDIVNIFTNLIKQ